MNRYILFGVFLIFGLFLFTFGCMEPPIKDPVVTVSDIALSDVSLETLTVNTTVIISNPNPIGARLNRAAFDVWYLDDTAHYLGHGEQTGIDVKEHGNTTVVIPVKIGTVPAMQATASLIRNGAITIRVNGSAFIDIKVTEFEKPFVQQEEFPLSRFQSLLPETALPAGSINITEKLKEAKGLLDVLAG